MKRSELLAVLVKAMGIWEIVGGVMGLPTSIANFAEYSNERQFLIAFLAAAFAFSGSQLIAGCVLFFGSEWIAKKAYPDDDDPRP